MQGTGLLAPPAEGLLMTANVVRVTLYCSECIIKSGESFFFLFFLFFLFFHIPKEKRRKKKVGFLFFSFLFDNHPPLSPPIPPQSKVAHYY